MLHIETVVKNFKVDRTTAKQVCDLASRSISKKIVVLNKNKQVHVYEINNGMSLQPLMMSECGRVFTAPDVHGYVSDTGTIVLPKAAMYLYA